MPSDSRLWICRTPLVNDVHELHKDQLVWMLAEAPADLRQSLLKSPVPAPDHGPVGNVCPLGRPNQPIPNLAYGSFGLTTMSVDVLPVQVGDEFEVAVS